MRRRVCVVAVLRRGDLEAVRFDRGVVRSAYYGDGDIGDEGEARRIECPNGASANDKDLGGHNGECERRCL